MRPLIVEVPSPLGLRPTGVERAPEVLRAAGLHALLGCDDAQRVAVPPYDDRRDQATGVLNPDGIVEVGNVYTLELGVMTSAGYVGIEEDVLVTETGCEFLSPFQRELKVI